MTTVRIPRPEDDRAPVGMTLAAACVGASLGLALAWWGQEPQPGGHEGEAVAETEAEAEAVAEAEADPVAEAEAETDPVPEAETVAEAETDPVPEAETDPVREAETDPVPEAEAAPAPEIITGTASLVVAPGRVAYLRCEGVPQSEGPFPCPRDETLEAAAWTALHALERCPTLRSPGAADVVLDFTGETAPTIRVRDTFPADTIRLDADDLLACAAGPLAEVRTILRPRRLVVSFRLALAAAPR